LIVVTVNSGSTSVKLAAFESGRLACGEAAHARRLDSRHCADPCPEPAAQLRDFLARIGRAPDVVAHRVVHGGTRFTAPVVINSAVREAIAELSELAPLHNPTALHWIDVALEVCDSRTRQVAAFDTAFFSGLPRVAAEYALPRALGLDQGVRRYGFHGLAHEAMWRRWCELEPQLPEGGRLITLQLGGGCSAAAIARGRPLDTSMGFSPLEGLVMATRSGDLDPAIVAHLEGRLGLSGDEVIARLNRDCGLAGLSGTGGNPQELLESASAEAQFAIELYCYRVRKYLGAYLAVLGGCDGIAFGGGVGEHVPGVRERILAGMEWAGVKLDAAANRASRGAESRISASGSRLTVRVVPVQEEALLLRAALAAGTAG
jgi:acetate kinase